MAENPADARLDQHQHQLDRLTALAERQDEVNRRLDQGLAQAQRAQEASGRRLDEGAAETRELNRRLDAGLEVARETNRRLETSLAKTDEILMTFGQIQSRMLDELEQLRTEQQRSNRALEGYAQRQEGFNERQDEFNQRQEGFNERQEEFNRRQDEFNRRQDEFNRRQEEFNRRQDEFNVIFLEEIRHLKSSDRAQQSEQDAKDELLRQLDARLRRLEDFMNGLQNAA